MIKRYGPVAMMAVGALLLVVGTVTGWQIRVPGMTIALAGLIVFAVMQLSKKLNEIKQIEAQRLALAQAEEVLRRPIEEPPPARRRRRRHAQGDDPPTLRLLQGGLVAIPAAVGGWLFGQAREHAVQTSVATAALVTLPIAGVMTADQSTPPATTVTEVGSPPSPTLNLKVREEVVVVEEATRIVVKEVPPEPEHEPAEEPAEVLDEPAESVEPANPVKQPEPEPARFEELSEPAGAEPEPSPSPEPEPEPTPASEPEPTPDPEPEPEPEPTRDPEPEPEPRNGQDQDEQRSEDGGSTDPGDDSQPEQQEQPGHAESDGMNGLIHSFFSFFDFPELPGPPLDIPGLGVKLGQGGEEGRLELGQSLG